MKFMSVASISGARVYILSGVRVCIFRGVLIWALPIYAWRWALSSLYAMAVISKWPWLGVVVCIVIVGVPAGY